MSGSFRDSDKLLLKYGPEEQWSPALVYSGYGGTFVGVKEVKINTSIKNNKHTFTVNINVSVSPIRKDEVFLAGSAQKLWLWQPRPPAAIAADQNIQFSSKSGRWGC